MKKVLVLLTVLLFAVGAIAMAGGQKEKEEGPLKVGVIQITLEHEYQLILNQGYKDKAEEMGVDVEFSITEMSPEKTVTAAENLIAAGCDAIICAPADTASWRAVENLCMENDVVLANDGSPQELTGNFIPFVGTESYYGGQRAGEFAVNWINDNILASEDVVVAHLTLPTFTDCVKRNEGFEDYLAEHMDRDYEIYDEAGMGTREGGLKAMENLLQAHPDINVVFGCNDDSALGALSAMKAADKKDAENLVIGFDGALKGFEEIMKGGMFRCDIAQQPYLYANMLMERAVKVARGEADLEDYVEEGIVLIETPVVTIENAQEWYDKYSQYMPED